ncbi:hypothetical protein [Domibacillus aminovorans]|uniref:Uncharacterized protein n=1 Tax=Domibacillus aminovorans TaxID=29332 RepID=A0A177L7N8_9BACI|nr:hypothetical protein [Domibacillus aminovorans]OAH61484.1 hypothetical protein AWH49_12840 [Domibacillus aminovorans]
MKDYQERKIGLVDDLLGEFSLVNIYGLGEAKVEVFLNFVEICMTHGILDLHYHNLIYSGGEVDKIDLAICEKYLKILSKEVMKDERKYNDVYKHYGFN